MLIVRREIINMTTQYPQPGTKVLLDTVYGPRVVTVHAVHPKPPSDGFHTLIVDDPFIPGVKVYASLDEISELEEDATHA